MKLSKKINRVFNNYLIHSNHPQLSFEEKSSIASGLVKQVEQLEQQLKDANEYHESYREEILASISEMVDVINKMKNCSNCKHSSYCISGNNKPKCDSWDKLDKWELKNENNKSN